MIGGQRHIGELPGLRQHVEIGDRRLHHHHVGALGEIGPDLLHRLSHVVEVLLVGRAVAAIGDVHVDGVAKRPVERRGVLCRIRQDRHVGFAGLVERSTDRADLAVHHPRRRTHVDPRGGLGPGHRRIPVEGRVVVHRSVGTNETAMAVIGVFVEAQIRHQHDLIAEPVTQVAQRDLDDAVGVIGARTHRVLAFGNPEQHHRRHTEVDELTDLVDHRAPIELEHPRQRGDLHRRVDALAHEQRGDEVVRGEHGLGDESTHRGASAKATQPSVGKLGGFHAQSLRMPAPAPTRW